QRGDAGLPLPGGDQRPVPEPPRDGPGVDPGRGRAERRPQPGHRARRGGQEDGLRDQGEHPEAEVAPARVESIMSTESTEAAPPGGSAGRGGGRQKIAAMLLPYYYVGPALIIMAAITFYPL